MSVNNITQWAEQQTTAIREKRLEDIAKNIRTSLESVALSIVAIGNELIEAKELLPHGEFTPWVRQKFDWNERRCQEFMNVARRFKNANFADLKISNSALYLLAAPSTPDEAVEQALEEAREGNGIGPARAKEIISEHKPKPAPLTNGHKQKNQEEEAIEAIEAIKQKQRDIRAAFPVNWRELLVSRGITVREELDTGVFASSAGEGEKSESYVPYDRIHKLIYEPPPEPEPVKEDATDIKRQREARLRFPLDWKEILASSHGIKVQSCHVMGAYVDNGSGVAVFAPYELLLEYLQSAKKESHVIVIEEEDDEEDDINNVDGLAGIIREEDAVAVTVHPEPEPEPEPIACSYCGALQKHTTCHRCVGQISQDMSYLYQITLLHEAAKQVVADVASEIIEEKAKILEKWGISYIERTDGGEVSLVAQFIYQNHMEA